MKEVSSRDLFPGGYLLVHVERMNITFEGKSSHQEDLCAVVYDILFDLLSLRSLMSQFGILCGGERRCASHVVAFSSTFVFFLFTSPVNLLYSFSFNIAAFFFLFFF